MRVGQGLEKTIEQPAFAAADRSMQVQAAGLAAFQAGGLGCHVFDDLQLAETQGVALGGGLGAKILTNAVSTVDFIVRHSPEASAQGTQRRTYPGDRQGRQSGLLEVNATQGPA
ncbi:hypothetical protein D9M73_196240 [compost metagenome]